MDLIERKEGNEKRHPWEKARANAFAAILRGAAFIQKDLRMLDIGCGDGFIGREIFGAFHAKTLTGIDSHMTDEEARELSMPKNGITYRNRYSDLERGCYDLTLLLDVVEHVEDDAPFLSGIVEDYMAPGGTILITAPAFQTLFGSHDIFLKHRRRYNRKALGDLIGQAKLTCVNSGYLFSLLLPIRCGSVFLEKLFSRNTDNNKGVGGWNQGELLSKIIEFILNADTRISIALTRAGIILPGLTVWALCRKRP